MPESIHGTVSRQAISLTARSSHMLGTLVHDVNRFILHLHLRIHCAVRSSFRYSLLTLCVLLLWSPLARTQTSASIQGIVTDASGAPVASATVKSVNHETGAQRTTVTDDAGRYLVLSLPVGEYEIVASKTGFQDAVRSGIHLVVGEQAAIDLRLQVGVVRSEVTVSGDAPIVSTTTRDISGLVNEQAVKQLPLNGRSYDLLLPLNP